MATHLLKGRQPCTDACTVRFGISKWRDQRQNETHEGHYVDVLLSLWPYLDEDSRDTLIRDRPPSAPVLLAAYRRAAQARRALDSGPADAPKRQADTA